MIYQGSCDLCYLCVSFVTLSYISVLAIFLNKMTTWEFSTQPATVTIILSYYYLFLITNF